MQLRRPLHERVPHQQSTIAQLVQGRSFFAPLIKSLTPSQTYGSPTPTFTRNLAGSYVIDFEGRYIATLANEARFMGTRRVRNVIPTSSEALSGAAWNTYTDGSCTISLTSGQSDPNGGTNAVRIVANVSAGAANSQSFRYSGNATITNPSTMVSSIYVKSNTGASQNILLRNGYGSDQVAAIPASGWTRISNFASIAGTSSRLDIGAKKGVSDSVVDIIVFGAQQENVTGQTNQNPSEYVSVGVLSAPYHGANVDGVKYFDTLNANTVTSNVVTEATGAKINSSQAACAGGVTAGVVTATRPLGLLVEGGRQNISIQNGFAASWSAGNITLTANNAVSPDGATDAATLVETVTNAEHQINIGSNTTTAAPWTVSVYAKLIGTTRPYLRIRLDDGGNTNAMQSNFNISTGAVATGPSVAGTYASASSSIVPIGNGWYRCIVTVTPSAVGTTRIIYYTMDSDYATSTFTGNTGHVGDTAAGLQLQWSQLELGSFASTPITTTTVAVTRPADVLTYPSAGNIDWTVGTAYAEFTENAVGLGDGDVIGGGGNVQVIRTKGTTQMQYYDGTSNAAYVTSAARSSGVVYKSAVNWSGSVLVGYLNGGNSLGNMAFDGNFGPDANIGIGQFNGGVALLFGCIANVRIWTRALPAATLAQLTL